jgi:hypothetical protein
VVIRTDIDCPYLSYRYNAAFAQPCSCWAGSITAFSVSHHAALSCLPWGSLHAQPMPHTLCRMHVADTHTDGQCVCSTDWERHIDSPSLGLLLPRRLCADTHMQQLGLHGACSMPRCTVLNDVLGQAPARSSHLMGCSRFMLLLCTPCRNV